MKIIRYTIEERERFLSLVDQWQESGMTRTAFAASIGMKLSKFYYWTEQHNKLSKKKSDFIEIPIPVVPAPPKDIILRYPNGIELILPHDFLVETIKALTQL
jgi:hypothetical protein